MKKVFIPTLIFAAAFTWTSNAGLYNNSTNEQLPPLHTEVREGREISDVIKKGETLFDIFKRDHLDIGELFKLRETSAGIHGLGNLHPGRPYKIWVDNNDRITSFRYWIDDDHILNITRSDPGFHAEKLSISYEKRILHIGGAITNNLISSIGGNRDGLMLALNISDILAWDIDFASDLRKGDSFKVIVEGLYLDGAFKKYGEILCIEFLNNGESYRAYRFEQEGTADYYDDEGKMLRRAFLKAPLSFRRISSTFTNSRFHPILKEYRPHHGLDYAAPMGTPVSAIGNGTVTFSGVKGEYGNLVIINHPNGYKTYYGHLSKIEKNVKKGVKVEQGQIIGLVGATGLATGPHLHYELRIRDKSVNPLTVSLPRGKPIPAEGMAEFSQVKNAMDSHLASMNPLEVVDSDLRNPAQKSF